MIIASKEKIDIEQVIWIASRKIESGRRVSVTSFEEFWDEHFGAKFGFHDVFPAEPYYSIGKACWEGADNEAFKRQEAVCEKYARELDEFFSYYKERKRGIKWTLRKFVSFFCNLRG